MAEVRENKVLIVLLSQTHTHTQSLAVEWKIVSHLRIINTCVVIRTRQHHFEIIFTAH